LGKHFLTAAAKVFGEKFPLSRKPPPSLYVIGQQRDLLANESNPA
jgi:hypothetical protein